MGARVVITFQGVEETINRLTQIEEKAGQNLITQTRELAKDTETAWKEATPRRTGRLQDADSVESSGLSFTLKNGVYYYPFVSDGHMTPRGWRTRRGYRLAKRRSRVPGQHITEKAMQFVEQNIRPYLVKFLDNV
jgi:hypothetical protein